MGAPTPLWWEGIKLARQEGATTVSLGINPPGAERPESPDHGLHAFKKSLGAEMIPFYNHKRTLGSSRMRVIRFIRGLGRRSIGR